ncbi:unnamed protein product [Lathyrus sativus]|nr:unnamed protein product [Lathyrus sativus]
METRIDPSKLCKKFISLGFDGCKFTEVRGYVGRISMGWMTSKIGVEILKNHFQFIHAKIKIGDEVYWLLTTVYVSPIEDGKRELLRKLKNIVEKVDSSWIVGGNFKNILVGTKKRGEVIPYARKCVLF